MNRSEARVQHADNDTCGEELQRDDPEKRCRFNVRGIVGKCVIIAPLRTASCPLRDRNCG